MRADRWTQCGALDVAGERGTAECAQIDGRNAVRRNADRRGHPARGFKLDNVALAIGERKRV
ncbi:MAG: hypothetical protein ABR898_14595 [Terracidiphilus sp.]